MSKDNGLEWQTRLYRPGDELGIVALYEQVFGHRRSPEWWLWKFKGLRAPIELTWVAEASDSGRIIGHYPGIPLRMKLAGQTRPAIVNLDVMTAPEFRRQGVLLRLGEEANRHWRDAGYSVVVGLPNEQWGSRTQMLGWRTLFPLGWLRFPLHLDRSLSRPGKLPRPLRFGAHLLGEAASQLWSRPRVRRLGRGSDISLEATSATGDTFDRLWADLERYYPNCVMRDAAYVQWRFLDALPVPYKLLLARRGKRPVGYIAYRAWNPRGGHAAYIADLFAAPGDSDAARALLGGALRALWKAGAGAAMVTAVPGSALYQTLREAGALPSSAAFHYDLIPLDPSLNLEALADPSLWLASGSDSDVV